MLSINPTARIVNPPAARNSLVIWLEARGYTVDTRTGKATRVVEQPAAPAQAAAHLDEYQKRALATRKRRAPAAKAARQALKAAIQRSKAIGQAARAATQA